MNGAGILVQIRLPPGGPAPAVLGVIFCPQNGLVRPPAVWENNSEVLADLMNGKYVFGTSAAAWATGPRAPRPTPSDTASRATIIPVRNGRRRRGDPMDCPRGNISDKRDMASSAQDTHAYDVRCW